MDATAQSLDLKLMRLAHVLLDEGSVSRTALRLGQSQPSVSLALKRLRDMLGDPLLVRSGARLVPTERGIELRSALGRVLSEMDRVLDPGAAFEPAEHRAPVRILAANCCGAFFMPRLIELILTAAPRATVDFVRMPLGGDYVRRVQEGEIDIVIGNAPEPPEPLRFAPLFSSPIVCVVRPGHPVARRTALSMDEYLTEEHLSPTTISSAATSPIDGRLAQLGRQRRIAVSLPEYALVPTVLARTDLIFTTGLPFADHLASLSPFAVLAAPPEFGAMHFHMLWHDRTHRSGAGRWLRGLIRQAAAEIQGEGWAAEGWLTGPRSTAAT